MLGAVYRSKGVLEVVETEEPSVRSPEDVMVRVKACGVCGTDLKMLAGEYEGTEPPVILGHEFSGEVAGLGKSVRGLSLGDRVVVDPNLTCGVCFYCRNSQENLCIRMSTAGMNRNGGMAEYCLVDARTVYKIPLTMEFETAAFAEPLACVLNGVARARVKPGESVGVIGMGPIGLLFARALQRAGAANVIGFEVSEKRADRARRLGVSTVVDPSNESWQREVRSLTEGRGLDAAVDTAALPAATKTALESVRRGGRVVIFGIPPHGATLEIETELLVKSELELCGSFIDRHTFPRAIELLSSRSVEVGSLLTHLFPLRNAQAAFGVVRGGTGLKVQIRP